VTPDETRAILDRFYGALTRRDAETMAGLYAPAAHFRDPVFPGLEGADIGAMWKALLGRAREFSVTYTVAQVAAGRGSVEWTARYLFAGKRPVVNVILSELRLENGLIEDQRDSFDFARWAKQAMGLPRRLFGRFAFFQRALQKRIATRIGLPKPA
jgi:hypothetical protein